MHCLNALLWLMFFITINSGSEISSLCLPQTSMQTSFPFLLLIKCVPFTTKPDKIDVC